MKRLMWPVVYAIIIFAVFGLPSIMFAADYKTITVKVSEFNFSIKIPAEVENFSEGEFKGLFGVLGAKTKMLGWNFDLNGTHFGLIVPVDDLTKPVALVRYVWRTCDMRRWIYKDVIPIPATVEEYTRKIFKERR